MDVIFGHDLMRACRDNVAHDFVVLLHLALNLLRLDSTQRKTNIDARCRLL